MALVKATDLGSGYSAEYYRIGNIYFDMEVDTCTIMVALYKDHDARMDGKVPALWSRYSTARATIFDKAAETVDNPLHACYEYLKTLDYFSGATDA